MSARESVEDPRRAREPDENQSAMALSLSTDAARAEAAAADSGNDGDVQADGRRARALAKRQSRRQHILDAAREVFAASGYHQTRVSDILARAEIARGTFYLYFESKSGIFIELLEELLDEVRDTFVGVDLRPTAPSVESQLRATVALILSTLRSHRSITTILFREAVGLDADVDTRLRAFYRGLHTWIRESLVAGQRMGVVRDLDVDVVAACILGSTKYLLEQDVLSGGPSERDTAAMAREIVDYNLRGLLCGSSTARVTATEEALSRGGGVSGHD